jgi:non-ribosomal peptide synthetase component F
MLSLQVLFQSLHAAPRALNLKWGDAVSGEFEGAALCKDSSQFDLAIEVHDGCISAEFSTELFDTATIQRMLHSYLQLLQQLVKAPGTTVGSAVLLENCDVNQMLCWGAGKLQPEHLRAGLVHEAFDSAAVTDPSRICLVFEGSCLSYGAVKCQADELAGRLQAAGVGPGVAVGVLLERSLELPIAVLAVFMAGGCYVPLDPSYPEQRLQGYLEDCEALTVLTHSTLSQLAIKLTAGRNTKVCDSKKYFHCCVKPGLRLPSRC